MARILVIDDEPMVGLMIRRMLSPPHDVDVQRSGRAALELLQKGARYDAIVADLHMPDGDGIWLRAEAARLDAAIPRRMLFLTGGAGSAQARDFLGQPGVKWLEKPFRAAELMTKIEEIVVSGS